MPNPSPPPSRTYLCNDNQEIIETGTAHDGQARVHAQQDDDGGGGGDGDDAGGELGLVRVRVGEVWFGPAVDDLLRRIETTRHRGSGMVVAVKVW